MIYIVMLLQHESGTHGQPQRDLIAPMTPPPNPPHHHHHQKNPGLHTHIHTTTGSYKKPNRSVLFRSCKLLFSGGGGQNRLSLFAINESSFRCGGNYFLCEKQQKKNIFCCSWIKSSPSLLVGDVGCCTLIKKGGRGEQWVLDVV